MITAGTKVCGVARRGITPALSRSHNHGTVAGAAGMVNADREGGTAAVSPGRRVANGRSLIHILVELGNQMQPAASRCGDDNVGRGHGRVNHLEDIHIGVVATRYVPDCGHGRSVIGSSQAGVVMRVDCIYEQDLVCT